MREEHVGLRSIQDESREILPILEAALDVHAANLRNVVLQVVSEGRVEVRVDPALLQIIDRILLMRIQHQQPPHRIIRRQIQQMLLLNIQPFIKSILKPHPRDLEALLAATAAAEQVVARAKDPEAAPSTLLVLARDEYLADLHALIGIVILHQYAHLAIIAAVCDASLEFMSRF